MLSNEIILHDFVELLKSIVHRGTHLPIKFSRWSIVSVGTVVVVMMVMMHVISTQVLVDLFIRLLVVVLMPTMVVVMMMHMLVTLFIICLVWMLLIPVRIMSMVPMVLRMVSTRVLAIVLLVLLSPVALVSQILQVPRCFEAIDQLVDVVIHQPMEAVVVHRVSLFVWVVPMLPIIVPIPPLGIQRDSARAAVAGLPRLGRAACLGGEPGFLWLPARRVPVSPITGNPFI